MDKNKMNPKALQDPKDFHHSKGLMDDQRNKIIITSGIPSSQNTPKIVKPVENGTNPKIATHSVVSQQPQSHTNSTIAELKIEETAVKQVEKSNDHNTDIKENKQPDRSDKPLNATGNKAQDSEEDDNLKYFDTYEEDGLDDAQKQNKQENRQNQASEEAKQNPQANSQQVNLTTNSANMQEEDSDGDLNSDDDPVELDLPDPEDAMFATHEKHSRHGSKWKVTLKQCILNVKGKEYILCQANGEFEFQ